MRLGGRGSLLIGLIFSCRRIRCFQTENYHERFLSECLGCIPHSWGMMVLVCVRETIFEFVSSGVQVHRDKVMCTPCQKRGESDGSNARSFLRRGKLSPTVVISRNSIAPLPWRLNTYIFHVYEWIGMYYRRFILLFHWELLKLVNQ